MLKVKLILATKPSCDGCFFKKRYNECGKEKTKRKCSMNGKLYIYILSAERF